MRKRLSLRIPKLNQNLKNEDPYAVMITLGKEQGFLEELKKEYFAGRDRGASEHEAVWTALSLFGLLEEYEK